MSAAPQRQATLRTIKDRPRSAATRQTTIESTAEPDDSRLGSIEAPAGTAVFVAESAGNPDESIEVTVGTIDSVPESIDFAMQSIDLARESIDCAEESIGSPADSIESACNSIQSAS